MAVTYTHTLIFYLLNDFLFKCKIIIIIKKKKGEETNVKKKQRYNINSISINNNNINNTCRSKHKCTWWRRPE